MDRNAEMRSFNYWVIYERIEYVDGEPLSLPRKASKPLSLLHPITVDDLIELEVRLTDDPDVYVATIVDWRFI